MTMNSISSCSSVFGRWAASTSSSARYDVYVSAADGSSIRRPILARRPRLRPDRPLHAPAQLGLRALGPAELPRDLRQAGARLDEVAHRGDHRALGGRGRAGVHRGKGELGAQTLDRRFAPAHVAGDVVVAAAEGRERGGAGHGGGGWGDSPGGWAARGAGPLAARLPPPGAWT